jgi:hypothetical protein
MAVTSTGVLLSVGSDPKPAQGLGCALLCLDVRYLGVLRAGAKHVDRASLTTAQWEEIADVLLKAVPSTRASSQDQIDRIDEARHRTTDLLAQVLAVERTVKVGWLSVLLVNVPQPEDVGSLDALLVSVRAELEREKRFRTMD